VITPTLVLDSREQWRPVPVEDSLAFYGLGFEGDRLNFPGSMKPADLKHLPSVGYHRVAKGGGLDWHQFWTWWTYNPKKYAGHGDHEGDWEMVQIGCVGDRPVLMSCSQHSGAEKREFWRVSLDAERRPLIYVARDSHASYFAPERDVTDVADGKGPVLDMAWRAFGDWATYGGRWGNSENSPGPLPPRRAWKAPHAYHGQGRG
jgi:hypothetical protein